MAKLKKILVSLPDQLLQEVDQLVISEQKNRSECIREAMRLYLYERHRLQTHERMKHGYEEMAKLNLEWAQAGFYAENESYNEYENLLARCEP